MSNVRAKGKVFFGGYIEARLMRAIARAARANHMSKSAFAASVLERALLHPQVPKSSKRQRHIRQTETKHI